MLTWHVVRKLIAAQRQSVSNASVHLAQLFRDLSLTNLNDEAPFTQIIESLAALEKTVAEDFRSRGQSVSDLVYFNFFSSWLPILPVPGTIC